VWIGLNWLNIWSSGDP